jgi:hypothetical protein
VVDVARVDLLNVRLDSYVVVGIQRLMCQARVPSRQSMRSSVSPVVDVAWVKLPSVRLDLNARAGPCWWMVLASVCARLFTTRSLVRLAVDSRWKRTVASARLGTSARVRLSWWMLLARAKRRKRE